MGFYCHENQNNVIFDNLITDYIINMNVNNLVRFLVSYLKYKMCSCSCPLILCHQIQFYSCEKQQRQLSKKRIPS